MELNESCPACGSEEVEMLNAAHEVMRCLDCGEHFDADEDEALWETSARNRTRARQRELD